MKHCRACDVDVATPAVLCPLCGTPLAGLADADCAAVYPPAGSRKEYNFVKRLLLLLSVVGAAVCIVVNLLVMPSFWWWTIVVTALVYAWAVVPHAMRRGGNAAGKVLMQVVAGSALAVLVDFETGYRGWGVSFVVPAFICAGIVAVVVLVMCNRTNWAGYVLYQAVLAVFGLAMPVLYFTGLAHSLVGAVVPAVFSAMLILGVDKNAQRMVAEIHRQFNTIKGLREGKPGVKPEYDKCIDIATSGSLRELIPAGLMTIIATIIVGFIGGPSAIGGFLLGNIVSGLLLALFMSNAGGLWDNTKKYIEAGAEGGKGSDSHKAAVIGDTVGDPFKDTAGPSINTQITVVSLVSSLLSSVFVMFSFFG